MNPKLIKIVGLLGAFELILIITWRILHCYSSLWSGGSRCPGIITLATLFFIPGIMFVVFYFMFFLIALHRKNPTDLFDKIIFVVLAVLFIVATKLFIGS